MFQASNPGKIKLKFFSVYLKNRPLYAATLLISFIVSIGLIPVFIPVGVFFTFCTLVVLCKKWGYLQELFLHGCLCPGVVVTVDPLMIASSTDLSTGVGSYPAIRIIKSKIPLVCGEEPKIGMKVATAALYNFASPIMFPALFKIPANFKSFSPLPVECATDSVKVARKAIKRIDHEEWRDLKVGLKYVPKPYRPGMYYIWKLRGKRRR